MLLEGHMTHSQKSILGRSVPKGTPPPPPARPPDPEVWGSQCGCAGNSCLFCLFFLRPSLTMYPRLAPNLPSSSLTHQSPGVTRERSAFGFCGCLREGACCGPFRHFSLNKIDDLALDGMIHLIALSLPVGCLGSDTALISWVRNERLCQARGWHEPKPGEG